MNELIKIYERNHHTSDKWGPDKNTHSYLSIYGEIFKRLRYNKNKILEIGIYEGDSLNLWAEYFPNSVIYGIDGNMNQISCKLHPNVHTLYYHEAYCDETVEELKLLAPFNIIIDDGSHMSQHQQFVIDKYFSLLADNGILIIEDAVCWIPEDFKLEFIKVFINHFPKDKQKYVSFDDRRSVKGNIDDILVVYDKKDY